MAQFADYAKWILDELEAGHSIGKAEFKSALNGEPADWTRVSHAVNAILDRLGHPVKLENGKFSATGPLLESFLLSNNRFSPNVHPDAKRTIGRIVAGYLKRRPDRHVVLGTGSTVLHVGVQMCALVAAIKRGETQLEDFFGESVPEAVETAEYSQLVWTVNLPLALYWCRSKYSPKDEVLIPGGKLKLNTARYSKMDDPKWFAAIVVVGADGCYYDKNSTRSILYANSDDVASTTNLFLSKATDSVICCVAGKKLEYWANRGQNSGPIIEAPDDSSIKKFLVTDLEYVQPHQTRAKRFDESFKVVDQLRMDGWIIVTKPGDFNQLAKDARQEPRVAPPPIRNAEEPASDDDEQLPDEGESSLGDGQ